VWFAIVRATTRHVCRVFADTVQPQWRVAIINSVCYWLGPKGFAYSGRYPTCSGPRIHWSNQVMLRCCDQRACSPKTGQHSLTPVSIFRASSRTHPLFDNPSKILGWVFCSVCCCAGQVTLTATATRLAMLRAQLRAACCVYTQDVLFYRAITACAPDNNTLPTALNFWERAVQFSVCCSRCCSHARLDHSIATPNYLFCVGPSFFVCAVHTSCMQQLNQLMPCLGYHCSLFAARNVIHAHHALCKLLGAVCRRCCQAITGKKSSISDC
jgi:hypothetical protein